MKKSKKEIMKKKIKLIKRKYPKGIKFINFKLEEKQVKYQITLDRLVLHDCYKKLKN